MKCLQAQYLCALAVVFLCMMNPYCVFSQEMRSSHFSSANTSANIGANADVRKKTSDFSLIDKNISKQNSQLASHVARLSLEKLPSSEAHESILNQALKPFYHGVASGDPRADRVILWTRITPERDTTLLVRYELATDTAFSRIAKSGEMRTNAERDYTVKVDVTGLEADKTYYYRFIGLGQRSIIGRTKTLPADTAQNPHVRVVIMSCSSYPHGFFNAYARIAERNDLDVVLHLGDYIYEYNASETSYGGEAGKKLGRVSMPANEIVSLADYRSRYSQYRLDPDLMRLHQQHPMVHIWDDHESANDSYMDGAENHTPVTEGAWSLRKAVSKRVVYEWMPTRENADTLIRRRFSIGRLVDVFMLDTRLEARDAQVPPIGAASEKARRDSLINAPNRTLLGKAQYDWLTGGLKESRATWKLLGNQVMFSPISVRGFDANFISKYSVWLMPFATQLRETLEDAFYGDVWSNYPRERRRLMQFCSDNAIKNLVIGTGDFHTAFALESRLSADSSGVAIPNMAVEFMSPSITSGNFDENLYSGFRNFFFNQLGSFTPRSVAYFHAVAIAQAATPTSLTALRDLLTEQNPLLKYHNLTDHGYTLLDFRADRMQGDYWFVDTILARSSKERFASGFFTRSGESLLQRASAPAAAKASSALPAPPIPQGRTFATSLLPKALQTTPYMTLLSAYPNPVLNTLYLNYVVHAPSPVQVRLVDMQGRVQAVLVDGEVQQGAMTLLVDVARLQIPSGQYRILLSTPHQTLSREVLYAR
ncbi:MAG: T9SS C-terminal target domain-containing protein [Candidatus Kapaibacterium sp.]|nr:MAG: T9SS C-terminal target domain-containing protein [Candidatus Kapabacteria bacterium]